MEQAKGLQLHNIAILDARHQGRIQDLIRGGAPDRDRPKTAILGPQFCRILVLGPHAGPPGPPPGSAPGHLPTIRSLTIP